MQLTDNQSFKLLRTLILCHVLKKGLHFLLINPDLSLHFIDKNRTRKTLNRKQRKIHYTGTFSENKKTITGQWRFKFGFVFIGMTLALTKAGHGTWTITLIN